MFSSLRRRPIRPPGWRNRNRIKRPDGAHWLTIPVQSKGSRTRPRSTGFRIDWEQLGQESLRVDRQDATTPGYLVLNLAQGIVVPGDVSILIAVLVLEVEILERGSRWNK